MEKLRMLLIGVAVMARQITLGMGSYKQPFRHSGFAA
jgi:hypothetical protein